jgi:hypothetical protein
MPEEDFLDYSFLFEFPQKKFAYNIKLDKKTVRQKFADIQEKPKWTELDFEKCAVCPLTSQAVPHCLLALATMRPIIDFKASVSYEKLKLTVTSPERTYFKDCDLQTALSSFMGFLMATSGCPHFERLRPMARFHLPFSTMEETIFRVVSSYLLGEIVLQRQNPDWSLKGIVAMYEKIGMVNRQFMQRLHAAATMDSSLNAVVILDTFAAVLPIAIESNLEEIKYLWEKHS